MPDRFNDIEQRVEKLLRYIELLNTSITELREQVETRANINKTETQINSLCKFIAKRIIK